MAASYAPYLPQNEPLGIAEGIWTVDGPVTGYGVAGVDLPCPTRMTVLQTGSGLALHSPTAFSGELAGKIGNLGEIAFIIAPNSFHYAHVHHWSEHLPEAVVLAPSPMPDKARLPQRTRPLGPGPLGMDVDVHLVNGGRWVEAALYHRPSGTLVLTDLLQNFEPGRIQGMVARAMLVIGGATGNPPRASIDMRLAALMAGHRKRVRRDLSALRALDPERVLIAHGRQPEGETALLLERGFAWA